ncbi:cytochrome c4, partial [bacterium]|nr:cytochrome c4 [bacterium]
MRRISTYAKRLCRLLPAAAFVLLAAGIAPLAAQPDET